MAQVRQQTAVATGPASGVDGRETPELPAACPHCEVAFLLEAAHLNAREGLVRCGACGEVFNAKWHLTADAEGQSSGHAAEGKAPAVGAGAAPDYFPDSETAENDAENDAVDETDSGATGTGFKVPDAAHGRAHTHTQQSSLRQPAESGALPNSPKLPERPAVSVRADPQTSRANGININGAPYIAPRASPLSRLLWSVAAFGLLVLLGLQVKYLFTEKYAQHQEYGPFLTAGCELFNCALPARTDSSRLTLTHTRIDLHPFAPGAIRITVKLVNEAVFAQPYPDLQVTLTDWNGRVVGRRTFPPGRYFAEGQPDTLGSGELGVMLFDIARPHEKAVGFEVNIVAGSASS